MKNSKYIIIGFFAVMALGACRSQFDSLLVSADVDTKYKTAMELYEARKYKKSAAVFESLSMQTSGLEMDDTVRFLWAMSNYNMKDYISAQANFQSFCELYSHSPFSEQANFLRLDCMFRGTLRYELDQTPTHMALASISEYMMDYPGSPYTDECLKMGEELQTRLDRKEFENAYLYYKMEDYIASRTALKNVLKDHPENKYREQVMYYLAKASFKYAQNSVSHKQKDRYMDFVDNYFNFIEEHPESKYRADLDQLYNRYQRGQGLDRESRKNRMDERKAEKTVTKDLKKSDRQ